MVVSSAGCAEPSAEQTFAEAEIETYAERAGLSGRSADADADAESSTEAAGGATPAATSDEPGQVPAVPAPTPSPEPTESEPSPSDETASAAADDVAGSVSEAPTPTAVVHEISAAGAALGCVDVPGLRYDFMRHSEAVAEAASNLVSFLWMCPITEEVHQALTCYEEESRAIWDAYEAGFDADDIERRSAMAQIRESNVMLCANGDVTFIGPGAIADRLEDEAEHG